MNPPKTSARWSRSLAPEPYEQLPEHHDRQPKPWHQPGTDRPAGGHLGEIILAVYLVVLMLPIYWLLQLLF